MAPSPPAAVGGAAQWHRIVKAFQKTVMCGVCYVRKPAISGFATLWQDGDEGDEGDEGSREWEPHLDCSGWLCHECAAAMQWDGIEYPLAATPGGGDHAWFRIDCPFCRREASVAVTEAIGVRGLLRVVAEQSAHLRKLDLIRHILDDGAVIESNF